LDFLHTTIDAVPPDAILRHKGIVHVHVRICEPIDSTAHADAASLSAAVREVMAGTLAELQAKRAGGRAPVSVPPASLPEGAPAEGAGPVLN
jgi:hypothetical protein